MTRMTSGAPGPQQPARPPQVQAKVATRRRGLPVAWIVTGLVTLILLALALAAQAEPRTLDTVTIEGEVRLPEVLFITSRDVARPMDWLGYYSGPTGASVAGAAALPFDLYVLPTSTDPIWTSATTGTPDDGKPHALPTTTAGDPTGSSDPIHNPEPTRSTQEEIQ